MKTLRSLLMACAAALALAGCGGSDGNVTTDKTAPVSGSWADVRVASGNQAVTLSWEDKTATKADTVTYNIYFSTSPGVTKSGSGATKISNVTSPYIHTGLTNGTAYYYVVTKVTNGKEGVESYEASAVPQPSLPATKTEITIQSSDSAIVITLSRSSSEPSTIKYNLYWKKGGDFTTLNAAGVNRLPDAFPGKESSYPMNGLENGATYYFRVTADTGNGEGPASKLLSAVPRKEVLSITFKNMTTQAMMGAPYKVSAQNGNQKAYLTWSAVTPPTQYAASETKIHANNTTDTLAYNVYWSNSPITSLGAANKITVGNVTDFTHPGITNNLTYYYVVTAMVTAKDSANQDVSPAKIFESVVGNCAQVSVVPEALYPAVPSGLAAAAGNQQVALSWNRINQVTYNLYWSPDKANWSKISGLTSNSYIHSGLTSGITYYYKVTAVIDGESDFSAIVSATP